MLPARGRVCFVFVWVVLCSVIVSQRKTNNPVPSYISQMYYINLDRRPDRNTHMLKNVVPLFEQKHIPYTRVRARRGAGEPCVPWKNTAHRCQGLVGIIKSNMYILETLPIIENTLILEDDWNITSLDEMNEAIHMVPRDWDIIRFDCGGTYPTSFAPKDTNGVFRTVHVRMQSHWFCGGAFAMLIRPSSIPILKQIWSQTPYDDLDCRLTSTRIKSYCVNRNIMRTVKLGTDIPKHSKL